MEKVEFLGQEERTHEFGLHLKFRSMNHKPGLTTLRRFAAICRGFVFVHVGIILVRKIGFNAHSVYWSSTEKNEKIRQLISQLWDLQFVRISFLLKLSVNWQQQGGRKTLNFREISNPKKKKIRDEYGPNHEFESMNHSQGWSFTNILHHFEGF